MGLYSTCVPISVLMRAKPSLSHIPYPSSLSSSRTLLPLTTSTNYHHCHPLHRFPLFYSKRNANEDELSSSEEEENKNDDDISSTIYDASNTLTYASSVNTVAFWVCSAIAFGVGLGFKEGIDKASEFFAGYILEQSLSVDNLFVFVLIFKYFKVPLIYQNRVLSYGIAGAVFFRLTLILLGTVTLQRFEAVNLFLAAILLYSSIKLFASEEDESDLSNNFVVKTCQKFIPVTRLKHFGQATPLLLTVAVIELSDIVFAVGLRSLYTIISESMSELEYLQPSIAVVLGFIGCKMILDYFGIHVSTEASLGFVASSLTIGVLLSLANKSDQLKK
ncbi:hypothetical protein Lal_00023454 [Lupinus albus]|nr:hypothetical protein Lal_00023454 [Lupinus albus]